MTERKYFAQSALTVKCPQCGKDAAYNDKNNFRPFCSKRCKTSDIAAWADESYKVPGQSIDPESIIDREDSDS